MEGVRFMKDDKIYAVCMVCGRLLYHTGPDNTGCVEIEPCPDCLQEFASLIQGDSNYDD